MASTFFLLFVFVTTCGIVTAQESCLSPRYRPGICINLLKCPMVINIFKTAPKPMPPSTVTFLKSSQCGFEGKLPKLCCEGANIKPQVLDYTHLEYSKPLPKANPSRKPKIEVPSEIESRTTGTTAPVGRYQERLILKSPDSSDTERSHSSTDRPDSNTDRPHSNTDSVAVPPCSGTTFCEEVDNYPKHLVMKAIEEDPELKTIATTDVVEYDKYDLNDKIDLCSFEEKLIYPKAALSRNDEWLYILNTDTFAQGVRVQTCRKEGKPCDEIASFPDNVVSNCEQNYTHRRLVAIYPNGTAIKDEWFSFPSSCCCSVTRTAAEWEKK